LLACLTCLASLTDQFLPTHKSHDDQLSDGTFSGTFLTVCQDLVNIVLVVPV
jgi:hypothetical protein